MKYHENPVYKRITSPGPKRILALDGGGIRGALSLGFLERIEALLRERYEDKDYRLYQYFDLIGGTSTGAIIATLLALGKSVEEIKSLYFELGDKIFASRASPWIPGYLRFLLLSANYSEKPLEEELEKKLGNLALSSDEIKTGLCIVVRRADDYRTYPFINHPGSKYFDKNKGILLRDLVRASSAAPTYFRSKLIQFTDDEKGIFVDGGVSSANNPALILFMIATMDEFGYHWHMGPRELSITSIGTGSYRPKTQMKEMNALLKRKSIAWAPELPDLFMADAASVNHKLLTYLSKPTLSRHIHKRPGFTPDDQTNFSRGAFHYQRYDIALGRTALQHYGISKSEKTLRSLRQMDRGENAQELYEIGDTVAGKEVDSKDFPVIFDSTYEHLREHIIPHQQFVDLIQPIIKSQGRLYKKTRTILARRATEKEKIITVVDRIVETENIAEPGDYIVINQTSEKESYVIKAEEFAKRYSEHRILNDGLTEYLPISKNYGILLTFDLLSQLNLPHHFYFIAPWSEPVYARIGDYILSNLEYEDIYRVERSKFLETYTIVE